MLELIVSVFTIIPALLAVMGVVVKVNRTLTMLDDSVKQLTVFMEKQSSRNHRFGRQLTEHEIRLARLEDHRKEYHHENI